MRIFSRRSVLSAFGLTLPIGLGAGARAATRPADAAPSLRFRAFEDSVREAFARRDETSWPEQVGPGRAVPCVRVEVGPSDLVRSGLQGSCNDRPFAGFPACRLKIVRTGSAPGPVVQGVRLYVSTVDIALIDGPVPVSSTRPLDFATLPPAPTFS